MDGRDKSQPETDDKRYVYLAIRLPPNLTEKLENTLKHFNETTSKNHTKQSFIYSAITEKFDKEQLNISIGARPRQEGKQVRLKIEKIVVDKLDQHLNELKKWEKNPGSRNLWLISAIEDKLNQNITETAEV
ncbi:MAG: hypothetical protein ChlgKO_07080 [Chlamydiales bacterium]